MKSYDPVREAAYNRAMQSRMKGVYDPEEYKYEKIIGKRSLTGELKLKRLKGTHRRIISLHARCLSNRDIAFVTGMAEISVSRIIRDPLSQRYLQELIAGAEEELKALMPLATNAVRVGLESDNVKTALMAADKFFRATGRYNHDNGDGRETAEDVIGRAMAVMKEQAGAIKELARPSRPNALDVAFEEVVSNGDSELSSPKTPERLPSVDVGNSSSR